MRDFQDFIDKNIAVSFASKEEFKAFMELCMKNGKETKYMHCDENCIASIGFAGRSKDYVTAWLTPFHFKMNGHEWKLTPASEFLTKSTPTIEIFQSKQSVVCLKKQDGKVIAAGKAKCNPEDEFNFDYGAKLAFERMQADIVRRSMKSVGESIAKGISDGIKGAVDALKGLSDEMNGIKTLKNGMRIKKQDKYEVGDRVLIKKNWKSGEQNDDMDYWLGKVMTIKEVVPIERRSFDLDYSMREDYLENLGHGWAWSHSDIKGKVIQ